jgi:hypothetical protein
MFSVVRNHPLAPPARAAFVYQFAFQLMLSGDTRQCAES